MTHVILNFHGIGRPERPLPPGEAVFWLTFDQFRRVLDAAAAPAALPVQITFDDGNRSDLALAAPELAARRLHASFFPLTGRLGTAGSLSAADLVALVALGMRIGLHGHDHADWRALDGAGQRREYDAARDLLHRITGQPITSAAIPFGAYDRQVLRALAARGLAVVFTSDRGTVSGAPWLQPRCCLRADMDPQQIAAMLAGQMPMLRRLRRTLGMARKRLL